MILPTEKQTLHSSFFNWIYEGDGMFSRNDEIGYFTEQGFVKL